MLSKSESTWVREKPGSL